MIEKYNKYILIFFMLLFNYANSQTSTTQNHSKIRGVLFDETTNLPLPYANILIQGKNQGVATNEKGYFSLSQENLQDFDTLIFQYVGYQTKKITVDDLRQNNQVSLKENIINLNEFFVFAQNHDAEEIVKNVLKNKQLNYKASPSKKNIFIRNRYISDIDKIDINFKKSSFSHLDEKMTKLVEKKIPKQSISYTDFLGDVYNSSNKLDTFKIKPIKIVGLKDKNISDLDQLEKLFTKMFSSTKENEYWKIKSGIIGSKVDVKGEGSISDLDSINEFYKENINLTYYSKRLFERLNKPLNDKKQWDFLYHTNDYDYSLLGGTRVNGEDVYIIEFKPKKGGKLIGKLYITINTFALVKADFKYDEGKTGTNIQMFGIGYTLNELNVSVFYEKINENYELKYYTIKTGNKVSFDRNVSLLKKKKRFLVDKELNEIKVRLNMNSREQNSFETLVLESKKITDEDFKKFKQEKTFKIHYVDQFNDNIWKGYNIIEPTKQMRDYKKMNNNE